MNRENDLEHLIDFAAGSEHMGMVLIPLEELRRYATGEVHPGDLQTVTLPGVKSLPKNMGNKLQAVGLPLSNDKAS